MAHCKTDDINNIPVTIIGYVCYIYMKKIFITSFFLIIVLASGAAAKEKKFPYTYQSQFAVDNVNRFTGYQLVKGENGEDLIVFVFDPSTYNIPVKKVKKVYVSGSFNSWSKVNAAWSLDPYNMSIQTLIVDKDRVMVPGVSGFPEFKFFIIHDTDYIQTICGKNFPKTREDRIVYNVKYAKKGYTFLGSELILFNGDECAEIAANEKIARKLKRKENFKKLGEEGFLTLANIRKVPGDLPLWRGYHPYKRTAKLVTDDDVMTATTSAEKQRIKTVGSFLERQGIKSVITLTGNEQANKREKIPNAITAINYAGNHYFCDLSVTEIYRITSGKLFGDIVADIVRFMISHPAPFYIHCHKGVDETGVICAFIEALTGCTWDEIKTDFEKSNDCYMGYYRNYRLLEYSFKRVLGKSPAEVENLQEEITKYFIENEYLKSEEAEQLCALKE